MYLPKYCGGMDQLTTDNENKYIPIIHLISLRKNVDVGIVNCKETIHHFINRTTLNKASVKIQD